MNKKESLLEALLNFDVQQSKISGILFMPKPRTKGINVNPFVLKGKGHKYIKHEQGYLYQIVLYEHDKNGNTHSVDRFEAILTAPEVYLSNIIELGFFGMIVKKTHKSSSTKFVDAICKDLKDEADR